MAILGLVSSETYDAYRDKNVRRSVQYQYPNGAAILTGLLSLMEGDETNDNEFSHWEERWTAKRTTTASQGSSKGPWKNSSDADLGDGQTLTRDTEYIVCLTDATLFRVGHVLKIAVDLNSAASTSYVTGVITAMTDVSGSPNKIKLRINTANTALVDNGTTNENVGKEVLVIGTAFAAGVRDLSSEVTKLPSQFTNYAQVFRTPFSFTGDVIKEPLKFDESGPYQDKAKQHAIDHMVEMEMAFLFGVKHKYYSSATASPSTGAGLPVYTSGGVVYYLERWEAGDYGTVTATADTDEDKRIIANTAGTITEEQYDDYMRRLFKKSNQKTNERLCLCGGKAWQTIQQLYRSKSVLNASLPLKETYGMKITSHETPFGTVYYKTHPLFNDIPSLENWMLFIDVLSLRYRPFIGRDTKLLTNRQENDADYRKDEWFSHAGMEMWFPERFMLIKNVATAIP